MRVRGDPARPVLVKLFVTHSGGPCRCAGLRIETQKTDVRRYGIHGVEMLFTAMGPGCTTVARTSTKDTDVCVGTWNDGRVGTFRGMRNVSAYGGYAYGDGSVNPLGGAPGYEVMLVAILEFFRCAKLSLFQGPCAVLAVAF
eukprot:COSAG02_NODE_182_length_30594_cov_23.562912_2_plen_142_part_00